MTLYRPVADLGFFGEISDVNGGNNDGIFYTEVNQPLPLADRSWIEISLTGINDIAILVMDLEDIVDPRLDVPLIMYVRFSNVSFIDLFGIGVSGSFQLKQGGELIMTNFIDGAGQDFLFQTQRIIAPPQAADITDYANLQIGITLRSGFAHVGTTVVRWSYAALEVPQRVTALVGSEF